MSKQLYFDFMLSDKELLTKYIGSFEVNQVSKNVWKIKAESVRKAKMLLAFAYGLVFTDYLENIKKHLDTFESQTGIKIENAEAKYYNGIKNLRTVKSGIVKMTIFDEYGYGRGLSEWLLRNIDKI